MIKLVYCIRKHADVSKEEFHRYWRENHAPLVTSFAAALHAERYIQSHTLDTPLNDDFQASRGLSPAYDGITEVWWRNEDDLRAGMATEEGRAAHKALLEDESKFIDFANSRVFMTRENLIFDRGLNHPSDGSPR